MYQVKFDLLAGFFHRRMIRKTLTSFLEICQTKYPDGKFSVEESNKIFISSFIFKGLDLPYDIYLWINSEYDTLMRLIDRSIMN